MATATTATRPSAAKPPSSWRLHRYEWGLALLGAAACLVATVILATGEYFGGGFASLALLVFGVVVVWCFWEPRLERSLVVFALYVGMLDGYLKLKTGNQFVTVARDLLLWAIAFGALWRAMGKGKLRLPPMGGLVLTFCAIVLVELAHPEGPGLVGSAGGVRQHIEFVPLFFLGYAVIRSESRLRAMLVVLVIVGAANGVVSYVQSNLTPAELAGWGAGYRERIEGKGSFAGSGRVAIDETGTTHVRPFGLGSEIGAGALSAALALPALAVLIFSSAGWTRLLFGLLGIGVALGVTTAGSRAALISCFLALAAFGLIAAASRNGIRTVIALTIGAAILYGVFSEVGSSSDTTRRAKTITPTKAIDTFTEERGDSVGRLDDYLKEYPLGHGVGSVGPAAGASGVVLTTSAKLDSETQWNLLVIELGVAGLLVILLIGARLLYLCFVRIRRFSSSSLRFTLAALAAPVVAMFAAAFAGPVTVSAPSAPYLWFVTGILSFWLITAYDAHHDTS